jgi:cold shock protein
VPSFPRAGQKPWPGEARPNEPLQPMAPGLEQAARPIYAGCAADNIPPAAQFIRSPDDGEAHDTRTHTTPWVGDKVQLTTAIPIVMTTAEEPVHFGLVKSLARPGGNITGLSEQYADLVPKWLELLKEPLADGFALTGGRFFDPENRWIFYLDADPACGQITGGTSGVALLPANDLRGSPGSRTNHHVLVSRQIPQESAGGSEAFVHYSAIAAAGFKSLNEGDQVEFEVTQGPKGPQAQAVRKVTAPAR